MKTKTVSEFIVHLFQAKHQVLAAQHQRLRAQLRRVLGPERFQQLQRARAAGRATAPEQPALPELDWRPRRPGSGVQPGESRGYFFTTLVLPSTHQPRW